jgi:uncharacterized protein (DUF433 family)
VAWPGISEERIVILPDFLCADKYGEIFLTGHRVTLYHIIKDFKDLNSVERLASAYPTVPMALIEKVIAFYEENKSEVLRYVEETRKEIERQAAAPPRGPSMAELKRRGEGKRQTESA